MDGFDKIFAPILGKPLIGYTLEIFQELDFIREIVLVLNESNIDKGQMLVRERGFDKVTTVCLGGTRRQDSVRLALEFISPCDWVIVHDGARPCVEPELIIRGLAEAKKWGSSVPAIPIQDTIKRAGSDGAVLETVDRSGVWLAQTPQIFTFQTLEEVYGSIVDESTDDADLVERFGKPVHLYQGSSANIKVTTRIDFQIAEAILKYREKGFG
jgi:2-C-methyl-D-erythritol 4-phosphate cytidylyltransferase